MKEFTYSEARQRLAALLERARREGAVRIRRKDGQVLFCGRSPRPADPRCDQRGPTPRPISTGVEEVQLRVPTDRVRSYSYYSPHR